MLSCLVKKKNNKSQNQHIQNSSFLIKINIYNLYILNYIYIYIHIYIESLEIHIYIYSCGLSMNQGIIFCASTCMCVVYLHFIMFQKQIWIALVLKIISVLQNAAQMLFFHTNLFLKFHQVVSQFYLYQFYVV